MITGTTRLFTIVADPVGHVQAPQMLNEYFAAHGIDGVLVAIHVSLQDLPAVIDGFRVTRNLGGFVVTMPHKTALASLCDEIRPAARAIGAINIVRRTADGRLIGDMLDGAGFVTGLRAQGHEPRGKRLLLVGAGGAACAMAYALAQAGATRVTIANRTRAKAEDVVRRVLHDFPQADVAVGDADPRGYDMVVNATSLGMKPGDALPLDVTRLQPQTLAVEIITQPEVTPWLAAARERGCRVHIGKHMLRAQIELMARFMCGEGDR